MADNCIIDDPFEQPRNIEHPKRFYWKYAIHDLVFIVYELFAGKRKKTPAPKELDLLGAVGRLLNTPKETAEICEHYIRLHRLIENTNARKRMELWATKIIIGYLAAVFLLVMANGIVRVLMNKELFSEAILIAILTTTTVNIIGLVIIVLKGYFHVKDVKDDIKE